VGLARRAKGLFPEAWDSFRRACECAKPGEPYALRLPDLVDDTERLIDLDCRFDALRRGDILPADGRECLELVRLCHYKGRPVAAARFFADAAFWLVDLNLRLHAIQKGAARPADGRECLELARLCHHRQCYVAAACFHFDAFADQPALQEDLGPGHRYHAACAAALAATVRGADADGLGGEEVGMLRAQARLWLQADLASWIQRLRRAKPEDYRTIAGKMRLWQQDANLAGVRDEAALARLPEEERQAWEQLWTDVASLLHQAGVGRGAFDRGLTSARLGPRFGERFPSPDTPD
jgi:hypothetical protein